MAMISALNGHRVTRARVTLPAWGCWYVEASIDSEAALVGAVTIVLADMTLKGTVLSGGSDKGRSHFRIVAGAGGWGETIPRRSYTSDAGVRLATVLGDAAAAAGETLDMSTVGTSARVGPAYARPEGPASRVLELLAPSSWYVGEDGLTRLGRRPLTALTAKVSIASVDRGRAKVVLASDTIAGLVPGVVVEGIEALDVLHEIDADGGLRSTIWGSVDGGASSRGVSALRALLEQLDPARAFRGVTEYRVVTLEGKRVNLQPVRVSTGMPDLRRVLARPGVPGAYGTAALGSRVLVGFVDSDESRPFVASFEDAEGEGFVPTDVSLDALVDVKLGAALGRALRSGDKVMIAGVQPGPGVTGVLLTLDPTVVAPGAPGVGFSKVLE